MKRWWGVGIGVWMLFGTNVSQAESANPPDRTTDWPTYNNEYAGTRFSPLKQLDKASVARLQRTCSLQLGDSGSFQSGMIAIDGILYVTTVHSTVAMDAATCAPRWRTWHEPEAAQAMQVNRGVAYLDGRLYRGTTDGSFFALDAKTGSQLWKVRLADATKGETLTMAPIAWHGRVFTGLAVGDLAIRGRLYALDAATGRIVWQFNTIPSGHEIGADTWKSATAVATGGGGIWSSLTLDVDRGELVVPVGNPAPAFLPEARPGKNLFTNSIVALDAASGALRWWYQVDAHDVHDWDVSPPAPLYTDREGRAMALAGSKDGHLYGIDRRTHRLRFKTPVTTIKDADRPLTAEGHLVCPGVNGGFQWNGAAVDINRNRIYTGTVDRCSIFRKNPSDPIVPGRLSMGGSFAPSQESSGWLSSLDASTGRLVWQYHASAAVIAGVTPTAGGIVLGGDAEGNFFALDSDTGEVLLKQQFSGALAGGIITYTVQGKQYVAVASGNVSKASGVASGVPTVTLMALDADSRPEIAFAASGQSRQENGQGAPQKSAKDLFAGFCSGCHGPQGEGLVGPQLRGITQRMTLTEVIERIKKPRGSMPSLYPAVLNADEVERIAAYLGTF